MIFIKEIYILNFDSEMTKWNRFVVSSENETCTSCGDNMGVVAPRCDACKRPTHIKCTEQPMYLLVHYFNSRVQYFCKDCTRVRYKDYDETLKKITDCINGGGQGGNQQSDLEESDTEEESSDAPSAPPASQVLTQIDLQVTRDSGVPAPQASSTSHSEKAGGIASRDGGKVERTFTRVCRYYKKGSCKFGRRGTGCNYDHPQICVRFQRNGDNINGCRKGNKCDRFHPHTCKYTSDGKHCGDDRCKRLHIRKSESNNGAMTQRREQSRWPRKQGEKQGLQHTNWRTENSTVESRAGVIQQENFMDPNSNAFLGVREEMKWMREQINKMVNLLDVHRDREIESRVLPPPTNCQPSRMHREMGYNPSRICQQRPVLGWGGA